MRNHRGVAVAAAQVDGFQGLGDGADLVDLDEDGVGHAFFNAALQPLDVGDEDVVAYELDPAAEFIGQQPPSVPVVFGETVFKRNDGVLADPVILEPTICSLVSSRLSLFLKTYLFFSLS